MARRAALLAVLLASCSSSQDASDRDGPAADAALDAGPADRSAETLQVMADGPARDAAGEAGPPDAAADVADAPADSPPDAGPDAASPDGPPPDTAAACSPPPDQHGFYGSCSACPTPGDCDTIDVNGSRRYACGCGGGCPCSLHCGSYVIPGTPISISGICVK